MAGEETLDERLEQMLGPKHGTVIHFMLGKPKGEGFTWFALDTEKFPDLVDKLEGLLDEFVDRGVPHVAKHPLAGLI